MSRVFMQVQVSKQYKNELKSILGATAISHEVIRLLELEYPHLKEIRIQSKVDQVIANMI